MTAKVVDRDVTDDNPNGLEMSVPAPTRFLSVDFYRGLVVAFMIVVNTPGTLHYVYQPLTHAQWIGCTLADLVFPCFLFLTGVSMQLSFAKFKSVWSTEVGKKILRRTVLIFLIGFLLNKFPIYWEHLDHWRVMGILQRIALSFGIASVLVLSFRTRPLILASACILLSYWGILLFFATPGGDPYGINTNAAFNLDRWLYDVEVDAAVHVDHWLFGDDYFWHGNGFHFDPEGILGVIPSVVTVILGWLSAALMAYRSRQKTSLLRDLLAIGTACCLAGLAWGAFFPISKKLWTSSFVLYAGGFSVILLAACIWLIDMYGWRPGVGFFLTFGANPLFAFILSEGLEQIAFNIHIGDGDAYEWAYTRLFQPLDGAELGSFLFALSYMLLCWLICRWLFVRRIFIKI